jgi:hypothetical protein
MEERPVRPTPFEIAQIAATIGLINVIMARQFNPDDGPAAVDKALQLWDEAAKQIEARYPEPALTKPITIRGTEGLTPDEPVLSCLCGAQFTGNGLQGIGPSRCPASPDGYHYVGLPDGSQRWIHVAPKEASGD